MNAESGDWSAVQGSWAGLGPGGAGQTGQTPAGLEAALPAHAALARAAGPLELLDAARLLVHRARHRAALLVCNTKVSTQYSRGGGMQVCSTAEHAHSVQSLHNLQSYQGTQGAACLNSE